MESDAYGEHAVRMWRFRQEQVDRVIGIVAQRGMTYVTAWRKDGKSLTAVESACPTCGHRQAETGPCKNQRCLPGTILAALAEVAARHTQPAAPTNAQSGATAGCHICGWRQEGYADESEAWRAAQGHKCPAATPKDPP